MKKALFLLFIATALFADSQNYPFVITSSGGNNPISYPYASGTVDVTTNGVVTLNTTFTISNSSQPPVGQRWEVIFYAAKLTVSACTNVNLFGVNPLCDYPGQPRYDIKFEVKYDSTTTSTYVWRQYVFPQGGLGGSVGPATFSGPVTFSTASVKFTALPTHAQAAQDTNVVLVGDSLATQTGCAKWTTCGNSGLSNANFVGNTDTVGLNFRVNNQPSGRIDYTLPNVALGYQAMKGNTTGVGLAAFGYQALTANTTGTSNSAFGETALTVATSGSDNTAIGAGALQDLTTGSNNTVVGAGAASSITTQSNCSVFGTNAPAVSNAFTLAASVDSIGIGGLATGAGWVATDVHNDGFLTMQPPFGTTGTTFTPVTGDSVAITTSKNTVNPSGTIANWTAIMPANPTPYQVYEFSFQQTVTAFHISTRLSGGTFSSLIPTGTSAGVTSWGIYWNPTLSKWVLN